MNVSLLKTKSQAGNTVCLIGADIKAIAKAAENFLIFALHMQRNILSLFNDRNENLPPIHLHLSTTFCPKCTKKLNGQW